MDQGASAWTLREWIARHASPHGPESVDVALSSGDLTFSLRVDQEVTTRVVDGIELQGSDASFVFDDEEEVDE